MPALPVKSVTFLFSDIEHSTRLLQHLGDRYADVLAGTDACYVNVPGVGWPRDRHGRGRVLRRPSTRHARRCGGW